MPAPRVTICPEQLALYVMNAVWIVFKLKSAYIVKQVTIWMMIPLVLHVLRTVWIVKQIGAYNVKVGYLKILKECV